MHEDGSEAALPIWRGSAILLGGATAALATATAVRLAQDAPQRGPILGDETWAGAFVSLVAAACACSATVGMHLQRRLLAYGGTALFLITIIAWSGSTPSTLLIVGSALLGLGIACLEMQLKARKMGDDQPAGGEH